MILENVLLIKSSHFNKFRMLEVKEHRQTLKMCAQQHGGHDEM